MRVRDRGEWRVVLGGFTLGLLGTIGMFVLWFLVSSGSQETLDITAAPPRTTTAHHEGLIAHMDSAIRERVLAERQIVQPVRGNLRFRIADLTWQDARHPAFVQAPELRGQIDTRAAGHGDVVIAGLSINGGDVWVEKDANGEWNYRRALTTLLAGGDSSPSQRTFLVTDIALQNVRVRVRMPDRAFEFRDVAAQLPRAQFTGPDRAVPRVTVARATGTLMAADSSYRLALEDARLAFPTGRVDFTVARLLTGQTRLAALEGTWGGDLPGYALRMSGHAQNVRFEDVHFFSSRLPATGGGSFTFAVRPVNALLTEVSLADARIESQGSRVSGSATIQFGDSTVSIEAIDARFDPLHLALVEQMLGDTLPYQGTIAGTARGTNGLISFDVATRLTSQDVREPFNTRFTGSVRLASSGFEIRRVAMDLRDTPLRALRAIFPGLPIKGTISGTVALNGPPGKVPLNLNVRVELAKGVAIVNGTIDLSGAVPAYDVSGRLLAINLQELLQPDAPPVFLTAHFSAVGSGTDPNTANARVHVEGRFTGWRTSAHDTIHVAARLQGGSLYVDSAAVKLATMTGSAHGNWRFAAPATGAIEYRLAFDPITPFGPYIPAIGDEDAAGSIDLAGNVTGERGNIRVAATTTGTALTVGQWATSALESSAEVVIGPPIPLISVTANMRDLRTPTAGTYQTASASVRLQSPTFALAVRADRATADGGVEIDADGLIPATGARQVTLQRARVDVGTSNWLLSAPAVFSWAAPGTDLTVRAFEMRKSDNNGLVRLDGRVLPLAEADFRLETVQLPVGDIQRLLGRPPVVSGGLTTTTTLVVHAGVPLLTMRFTLDSAVVEAVRFTQVSGDASYSGQKLSANAKAIVDTTGALELHAELPMQLILGPNASARLLDAGPVRVTLTSDSIALAPFAVLSPAIEKLSGTLAANITVTGTVQDPLLAGTMAVRDAALRVIPLNQRFDSISGVLALENRRAVIQQLHARSGGYLDVRGNIEFRDLTKPVLDITVDLNRFRAVGVDNQDDAQISGQVQLAGPLRSAVLTGRLSMAEGYFPVPQVGSSALDAELARFEPEAAATDEPAPAPLFSNTRIAGLRLSVGPNLWFAMQDARAELSGDLTIDKTDTDTRIVGELEGERGTYVLRAGPIIRRFDVVHANVRFLGGSEINPAIDISAQRLVIDQSGRQLNIQVRVAGTLRSPTLELASEDAATIPQSELLSFLLFGQPSFAFGGSLLSSGQEVLTETLGGGLTELASIELEQSLLDQLGMSFDVFQIRLGGARLTEFSPSLVVGREIASNVFITVETAVNALFGGQESTGARFALHLEWRINRNSTLRASYEPANKNNVLRGYTVALPAALRSQQPYQTTLDFRRRWTW